MRVAIVAALEGHEHPLSRRAGSVDAPSDDASFYGVEYQGIDNVVHAVRDIRNVCRVLKDLVAPRKPRLALSQII